jgi:hypothetical protein
VFLLLGAIVNVAVAWGIAISYHPGFEPSLEGGQYFREEVRYWRVYRWTAPGSEIFRSYIRDGLGGLKSGRELAMSEVLPSWINPLWVQGNRNPNIVGAYGWPTISMWCQHDRRMDAASGAASRQDVDAWLLLGQSVERSVPLNPISPNFAINTIFYAAILWMLFFAPGSVRRTIRRRRGLCPACAYPIGTSPVCTECGDQLPLLLNKGLGDKVSR